jgi:hypothetical protein
MASEQHNPPPPDPFFTPIPANMSPEDLDNHRRTLEGALEKELEERRKFGLEQQSANVLSNYRQRCMLLCVDPNYPLQSLNFDNDPNARRMPSAAIMPRPVGVARAGAEELHHHHLCRHRQISNASRSRRSTRMVSLSTRPRWRTWSPPKSRPRSKPHRRRCR